MLDAEWEYLDGLLSSWWPGEWDDARSQGYRLLLDNLRAGDVASALQRLAQSGQRFRPAASEVYAAVNTAANRPRPTPEEGWTLIEEAIRVFGTSPYSQKYEQRHAEAVAWLAERDEVLAAWANRRGLFGAQGTLGHVPVHDPQYGGAARHGVLTEFKQEIAIADDRVARGLPPVPQGALEPRSPLRIESGGGMSGLLDRLRPEGEAPQLEPGDDDVSGEG